MSREQIIRDTAYAIWQAEGRPEGRDVEHWRQAEERVAASTGEPSVAKKPAKGKVSATASDKPKPAAPLKNAATGPKSGNGPKSASKSKV
jgi:hypothetical protein